MLSKDTKIPVKSLLNTTSTLIKSKTLYIRVKDKKTGKTLHLSVKEDVIVNNILNIFRRKMNAPKDADIYVTYKSTRINERSSLMNLELAQLGICEPLVVHYTRQPPYMTSKKAGKQLYQV